MSLLDCWNSIHETGQVTVAPPVAPGVEASSSNDAELPAAIEEVDARWREELAGGGEAPPLVVEGAIWALRIVRRAAQFLVYREAEPEMIHAELAEPCPRPPAADVCYSVDLALRVLPDLLKLARAAAPEDPLVEALVTLAKQWPLSSVGCGERIERADVSGFIENAALRQLYVDRIIERGDLARLDDPRVAADVRRAIGIFPQLASNIARAMAKGEQELL